MIIQFFYCPEEAKISKEFCMFIAGLQAARGVVLSRFAAKRLAITGPV
jgi:hypothetical protein